MSTSHFRLVIIIWMKVLDSVMYKSFWACDLQNLNLFFALDNEFSESSRSCGRVIK